GTRRGSEGVGGIDAPRPRWRSPQRELLRRRPLTKILGQRSGLHGSGQSDRSAPGVDGARPPPAGKVAEGIVAAGRRGRARFRWVPAAALAVARLVGGAELVLERVAVHHAVSSRRRRPRAGRR